MSKPAKPAKDADTKRPNPTHTEKRDVKQPPKVTLRRDIKH